LDFISEVIEDVKKAIHNLNSSEDANIEPLINVIEDLARTKALRVLDVWLDVLSEEPENDAINQLYDRITSLRYVEMEDKSFLEIKNVLTKENILLYSGYDDLKAWEILRQNKENYPGIRIEYWKDGEIKNTRFPK